MNIDKDLVDILKIAANHLEQYVPKMIKTSKKVKFTFNKIIITDAYGYSYGGVMSDGHLAILYTTPMKRGRSSGPGSNSPENRELRKKPPMPTNVALCSVMVSKNKDRLELEYIPTDASKEAVNELMSKIKHINNISTVKESKLKSLIKKIIKEEMYNSQFTIKFKNNDGNTESVYVDARNERIAKQIFEREYEYDEIISVEENVEEDDT